MTGQTGTGQQGTGQQGTEPATHEIGCDSLAQSQALAAWLAGQLARGDIVLLEGSLGAGKTTFVAMLCAALGVTARVSSPTYVISNTYPGPQGDIFHLDAYRLGGIEEFHALGIDEFFPEALTLIEWGDRLAPAFDAPLRIEIGFGPQGPEARRYRISGTGARWPAVIAALAAAPATDTGAIGA